MIWNEKDKAYQKELNFNLLLVRFGTYWTIFAERGGFEPPVGKPLRQFSKLLV